MPNVGTGAFIWQILKGTPCQATPTTIYKKKVIVPFIRTVLKSDGTACQLTPVKNLIGNHAFNSHRAFQPEPKKISIET